jgi:tripartite ATP-independent transporter DctP family solute receptor
MKKSILCFVLVLMLSTAMFAGCAGDTQGTATTDAATQSIEASAAGTTEVSQSAAVSVEPMTFKWSIATAADHPASIITQEICDQINKETNGVITIELYPANALGSEAEATDMVRSGAILGGTLGMQMFQPYCDEISGFMLPYTFESVDALDGFFWGYAKDNYWNTRVLEATGMRTLGGVSYGMRHLTTKGIAVHSPADLKGVKIRSMEQPISISYVTSLGGNPVPIAWSELYMALQTGTAVGQENPISNIIAGKFYEVQDYLVLTGHAATYGSACVNDAVWATIPAEYQQIIEDAFVEGCKRITQETLAAEATSVEELKAQGMTVLTADEIDFDAFVASAAVVVADQFSGTEYDAWREYQQIAIDWCQENGF